jgi:hypothetical protein
MLPPDQLILRRLLRYFGHFSFCHLASRGIHFHDPLFNCFLRLPFDKPPRTSPRVSRLPSAFPFLWGLLCGLATFLNCSGKRGFLTNGNLTKADRREFGKPASASYTAHSAASRPAGKRQPSGRNFAPLGIARARCVLSLPNSQIYVRLAVQRFCARRLSASAPSAVTDGSARVVRFQVSRFFLAPLRSLSTCSLNKTFTRTRR